LYNEFKFFFNMFFLLIALSQFIPQFKVGLLFTYVAPLCLVLTITMLKEAYDDIQRFMRDKELNSSKYERVTNKSPLGLVTISAQHIKVG
jgi:phospholipid-translocating ATPase